MEHIASGIFTGRGVKTQAHSYHVWAMLTLLIIISMLLTGCGKDKDKDKKGPVYKVLSEGTLKAGDAIPVPAGEPVLTVTGSIGNANQDGAIVMDIATIESVGRVEYTVTDPFEEAKVTYQGVLMSDLLKLWEVDPNATTLSVLALNDYQIDVPLKDVLDYPVIFAMQKNGEYMPVSTRGPAMLVFPYDDFEFDHSHYNDMWAWQIKSINIH